MRFTRLTPSSLDDLRRAVLEEIEAVSPGLRIAGGEIPVADDQPIDALTVDARGRLGILCLSLTADHLFLGSAIERWSWALSNARVLRALAPNVASDSAAAVRLVIVASRWTPGARLLAAALQRPEIDLFEAVLLSDGSRRGLLVEPLERPELPDRETAHGAETVLAAMPSGAPRSLTRRIVEEIRGMHHAGETLGVTAAVSVRRAGRAIGSFVPTPDGLTLHGYATGPGRAVATDEDCREAIRALLAHEEAGSPVEVSAAASPLALTHLTHLTHLTNEELAEFEKLEATARHGRGPVASPPAAAPAPSGWLEN